VVSVKIKTQQKSIFLSMGKALPAEKVKLFVAVMYSAESPLEEIKMRLQERFGAPECFWGPVDFSWTDYYTPEMGGDLKKLFAS